MGSDPAAAFGFSDLGNVDYFCVCGHCRDIYNEAPVPQPRLTRTVGELRLGVYVRPLAQEHGERAGQQGGEEVGEEEEGQGGGEPSEDPGGEGENMDAIDQPRTREPEREPERA